MSSIRKKAIIPIFVPHKGCPHDCVFCNQDKITGYKEDINKVLVKERIEMYLSTMTDRQAQDIEIAFYGGSFTAIDFTIQKIFLRSSPRFLLYLVKLIVLDYRHVLTLLVLKDLNY